VVYFRERSRRSISHPHIYYNKRAEMWGSMRDFLKIGCINNDLRHELMGPIDMSKSDRHNGLIILESKEDIKINL
jgi:hypothetical protein